MNFTTAQVNGHRVDDMEPINFVCIPFHDIKLAQLEGFRTRDSHLYRFFAQHEHVMKTVVLNRPTMLLELLLKRKTLKSRGEVLYAKNGLYITKINDRLFAVDILDLSFFRPVVHGKAFIPTLYSKHVRKYSKALSFLKVQDYVTYESSPLTVALCDELKPKYKVFDGVDNLCKHSTYARISQQLRELYTRVIDTYPMVFFNSRDSVSYFGADDKNNVEFLANGVDFNMFRGEATLRPTIMEGISGPVVIYAGKMQEMLDTELIRACAERLPQVTFLLLGKVLDAQVKAELSNIANVKFTGDIAYPDLPDYIRNADVCFIPYRVDKQHGGDPIKFYEYMAANKKTLSTPIGEIEKYHNGESVIVCARDKFVESLERLLQLDTMVNNDLPESMTWSYKADYMVKKATSR